MHCNRRLTTQTCLCEKSNKSIIISIKRTFRVYVAPEAVPQFNYSFINVDFSSFNLESTQDDDFAISLLANEVIHADDTGAYGWQGDSAAFGRPDPYLGGDIYGRFRGTYDGPEYALT